MRSDFDMSMALSLHSQEAALHRLCAAVAATVAPVQAPLVGQNNRKQLIHFGRLSEFNPKRKIHRSFFAETVCNRLSTAVDLANSVCNGTSTNFFLMNSPDFGSSTVLDELLPEMFTKNTLLFYLNRIDVACLAGFEKLKKGFLGKATMLDKATTVVEGKENQPTNLAVSLLGQRLPWQGFWAGC